MPRAGFVVTKRPAYGIGVPGTDTPTTPRAPVVRRAPPVRKGSSVTKPVVLIAEELSPATIEALGPDFEVRSVDGADREALLPALADVDAILIRSATRMDAEAIAAAKQLKVIARAGVGLDNVDVQSATQAGVMVVNAPTSNITSAAELAVALLLATARNIAPANQALKAGAWKRSKYSGVELLDKTVGVVGLGRIGALVAERLKGFGMRIVNAARGGIVDEAALARAIAEGRVAGAGIDVFASEPTTESPLFEHESVVVTPHLGASTEEAQEKAGIAVARSVRLALGGELVPDAVNVSSGFIAE